MKRIVTLAKNIRLLLVKNKHSRELQHYSLVSVITEMLEFPLSTQKSLTVTLSANSQTTFFLTAIISKI